MLQIYKIIRDKQVNFIKKMMENMRNNPPSNIGEYTVISVGDYDKQVIIDTKTGKTERYLNFLS